MKKKIITSAALGAAILGGTVGYAATSILPASAQAGPATQGQDQQQGQPDQQQGRPRLRRAAKAFIQTAADTIGVQPKDLLSELKAGKSIADVATENGKSPQAVVDAIVAKINERVDKAVEDGKLSAEKAAEIKAKAPERVTKMVNAKRQPGQDGPRRDGVRQGAGN